MKAVFLRGAVPPAHEHPEKLLYSNIDECEDMWTQLFYYLLRELDASGELLYKGSGHTYSEAKFCEKWVSSFKTYTPPFDPDLIICRGGFAYYDGFVKRFPKAKKIYYGAGRRFWPETDFTDYDLFLADSDKQLRLISQMGKKAQYLLKPAATMFKPHDVEKEYDVCFMANAAQRRIKRHDLFIKAVAGRGLKVLNIGNKDKELVKMAKKKGADITWGGWHLRKFLPEMISKCRVGVCCSGKVDSCPRVIPEYLACGLPVVVTWGVNFWRLRYVPRETGTLVSDADILKGIRAVLANLDQYSPREYYEKNIGMRVAAKRLADQVRAL